MSSARSRLRRRSGADSEVPNKKIKLEDESSGRNLRHSSRLRKSGSEVNGKVKEEEEGMEVEKEEEVVEEAVEKGKGKGKSQSQSLTLDEKRVKLSEILDRHDDHVRLLFHLEKFISLVHYDPEAAKEDHSNVFEEYRLPFDLWQKVSNVRDGGSIRHTRRQLKEMSKDKEEGEEERLVKIAMRNRLRMKKEEEEDEEEEKEEEVEEEVEEKEKKNVDKKRDKKRDKKGDKAILTPRKNVQNNSKTTPKTISKSKSTNVSKVTTSKSTPKGKGKKVVKGKISGRRGTQKQIHEEEEEEGEIEEQSESESDPNFESESDPENPRYYDEFGKRIHIPSYSSFNSDEDDLSSNEGDIIPRIKFKFSIPSQTITHPSHIVTKQYDGSINSYLKSFVSLDDDISYEERDQFIQDQVKVRNRIDEAKKSGVLILHESKGYDKFIDPYQFHTSHTHRNNLVSHAIYFARLMMEERKSHLSRARRIANMIDLHFKRLSGAEEKERKQFERSMKQMARKTGAEVMKKWKIAEKVVRQRHQQAIEEQLRREGKLQLNQILEQSAQLLEARTEKMIGNGGEFSESEGDISELNSDENEEDSEIMSSDSDSEEVEEQDDKLTVEELRAKYSELKSVKFEEDEEEAVEAAEDEEKVERDEMDIDEEENGEEEEEEEKEKREENDDDHKPHHLNGKVNSLSPSSPPIQLDETAKALYDENDSASGSDESIPMDSELDSDSDDDSDIADSDDEEEPTSLATLFSKPTVEEEEEEYEEVEEVDEEEEEVEEEEEPKVNEEDDSDTDKSKPTTPDTPTSSPDHEITHSSHIPSPFLLHGTLREYQHDGLDWLAGLYSTETNGILADEMGLGKTIQTIALISYLACEKHVWGPHLIVVPTSVMLNWEMEFKRFAPGFKVMTYYGNPAQRKEKRKGWNKEDTWHVCITSYQLVLQDRNVFKRKRWHYMILDEAHNIKNFRSQRWQALLNFNSQRRLLLTGTPLQNNLVELWSLLYFLMPSSKGNRMMPDGFANLKDFQDWFARPVDKLIEEGGDTADDETRATVTKLHQILRPYLLRRLKADVEKQMPAKYEHIVYCRLSKRQRYLYDDFMSRAQTRETLASGNFLSIINCLMQLRKVCNHPDLFEVRPIVTSLAIGKSVVSDYEPYDLIVRKRLLEGSDDKVNLLTLNLLPIRNEMYSSVESSTFHLLRGHTPMVNELTQLRTILKTPVERDFMSIEGHNKYKNYLHKRSISEKLQQDIYLNLFRCSRSPIYGTDVINCCSIGKHSHSIKGFDWNKLSAIENIKLSYNDRDEQMKDIITRYAFVTPKVVCLNMTQLTLGNGLINEIKSSMTINKQQHNLVKQLASQQTFHESQVKLSIAFPDKSLLQYDCGKLQRLATLMRDLIDQGHRALIFTQMTKVLDILEQFLNIHGWRYLRLDGATKVEQRQILTERFNTDSRIPVFILSTRSGGLGINLTGADTVIFYDSDWNPSMDKQCQDRCHRIGQTRDVHIYRFVSEYTIESNILRKATQKQILDNVVIQEGDFTTDYFHKLSVKELVGDVAGVDIDHVLENAPTSSRSLAKVLAQAEDADDAVAASVALKEVNLDAEDFTERNSNGPTPTPGRSESEQPIVEGGGESGLGSGLGSIEASAGVSIEASRNPSVRSTVEPESEEESEEESDDGIGHIDDYMIRFIEGGYFGD